MNIYNKYACTYIHFFFFNNIEKRHVIDLKSFVFLLFFSKKTRAEPLLSENLNTHGIPRSKHGLLRSFTVDFYWINSILTIFHTRCVQKKSTSLHFQ